MLPKVRKPTAGQHRPIALTNTVYKLFMTAVKGRLVEHLEENGRHGEYQAGFTKQRRLEENSFILRYCVEESFSRGEQLIVVAVDFAKAFNSVGRAKLIEAMKEYKCDGGLIEVVANIYQGDVTEV